MVIAEIQLPFSFAKPDWLWLALLAPLTVALSYRPLATLERARRALVLTVRTLLIIAAALTLARLERVRRNKDLTVLFLMDRSLSVRNQTQTQEQYVAQVGRTIPPDDRLGVIDFARYAYLEQLPMKGGYFIEPGRLPELPETDRTNIASAIRLAMAMFPHDAAKRIVLMSDGNDNMGDVLTAARSAKADGVSIDVLPLRYHLQDEIYFDKMFAPTYAEAGEIVAIRMNIHSTRTATGVIEVLHNRQVVPLPENIARQTLRPGNNSLVLRLPVESDGVQRFQARFIPDDPAADTLPDNNVGSSFSYVSGRGKVAVMTIHPDYDQVLVDALKSENIRASLIDVSRHVPDMAGLLDYSAVILANVPANIFTDQQQRMLATYVEDTGGGLIMTGGDESFGAGGWIGTPIADVLPVELEIKHKRIIPRGALAIILHSCEFPRGNAWAKLVAKKSVDTISSRDYIGILAWSGMGESWEVPLQIAANKPAIRGTIDRAIIGDMPDFETTMRLGVRGLTKTDAAQKHMIIISDGDPTPPSLGVIQQMQKQQITCTTIGVGYGSHVREGPLRDIARKTGGRFYPVRNPRRLPQIFVKESRIVRRPLIINETFQPQVAYALSDLLPGITTQDAIPPLDGLVLTSPKPPPAVTPLVRVTTDGRDPVLAHWQRGLGRVVAFTSGNWPKWGARWTNWAKFSKLWAQIIRWTMRQDAPANFDTFMQVEGNRGRIIIEALDADADYLNFLDLRAKTIDPNQKAHPLEFTQTGPGRYEATFDIEKTGLYVANVAIYQDGKYQGSIHGGVSMPFSPEFRELQANEPLLDQVAQITGGRVLSMNPQTDRIFNHDLPPTESRQPAWDWTLAWLVLPLFLLDVATRRLANWLAVSVVVELLLLTVLLFGLDLLHGGVWSVLGALILAELVGWTIRYQYIGPLFDWMTHTVTVLGRTGQRSSESLSQLKDVSRRVRQDQTGAGEGLPAASRRPSAKSEPPPPIDPKARFDAGEETPDTGEPDLAQQLGGAKKASAKPKPDKTKPGTAKPDDDSGEATTSRLLKAKRRARGNPDEAPNDKDDQNQ